jgi:hypothetical protein
MYVNFRVQVQNTTILHFVTFYTRLSSFSSHFLCFSVPLHLVMHYFTFSLQYLPLKYRVGQHRPSVDLTAFLKVGEVATWWFHAFLSVASRNERGVLVSHTTCLTKELQFYTQSCVMDSSWPQLKLSQLAQPGVPRLCKLWKLFCVKKKRWLLEACFY